MSWALGRLYACLCYALGMPGGLGPGKMRASLYVDEDIYQRAKVVTAGTPFSVSSIVNNVLHQLVPFLEEAKERAAAGDRAGMLALLDAMMSGTIATTGADLAALRTELQREPGEEEPG